MTPFGKFMRHLRLDKGLMLKESAEKLGVTSAYLSALEHGKKGVPGAQLVDRIIAVFGLDAKQAKTLRAAVRDSGTRFDMPAKSTPDAFLTANIFARRISHLSESQLRQIRSLIDGGDDE